VLSSSSRVWQTKAIRLRGRAQLCPVPALAAQYRHPHRFVVARLEAPDRRRPASLLLFRSARKSRPSRPFARSCRSRRGWNLPAPRAVIPSRRPQPHPCARRCRGCLRCQLPRQLRQLRHPGRPSRPPSHQVRVPRPRPRPRPLGPPLHPSPSSRQWRTSQPVRRASSKAQSGGGTHWMPPRC
jgi:hypothetical protein